jgi:hypothetical protein
MAYLNHDQALLDALQDACDYCESLGVDASGAMKRRDKNEPARREKEQAEIRLERVMRRIFAKQSKRVEEWLKVQYPGMPLKFTDSDLQNLLDLDDDELADLILEFVKAAQGGVKLFATRVSFTVDWTLTNSEAAKWAKEYIYKLIKGINETTVKILQSTISTFVETPGNTIGDVIRALSGAFDEKRAGLIGITETTRAFAQGEIMAGKQLQIDAPGVKVQKQWFTNLNEFIDEHQTGVCELCKPLHGKIVDIDQPFYEITNEYQDGNPPLHPKCFCNITTFTNIQASKEPNG